MLRLSLALSVAAAATAAAQNPIAGIWDLDETSGFTASDSGPNRNDGTLINFSNDPAQWTPGVRGNALTFDGADDYVQLAMNGGLPFYDGLGAAFSICVWINGQPTEDDRVLSLGSSASNTPLWTLGTGRSSLATADRLQVFARNAENISSSRYSTAPVFDGTWHHVAYVETSGRARLYVDGVLDPSSMDDRYSNRGTRNAGHGTYTFDLVSLGGVLRSSLCCHFTGSIDELRIYGFELSAADVMAVMGGGQPPSCRASLGEYGVGCGAGPLELAAGGAPVLGGPGVRLLMFGGTPSASALLNIGVGTIAPLDLSNVGLPGCTFYAPGGTLIAAGNIDGFGMSPLIPVAIPNIAALACQRVSFQGVALGAGSAELSNAVLAMMGN